MGNLSELTRAQDGGKKVATSLRVINNKLNLRWISSLHELNVLFSRCTPQCFRLPIQCTHWITFQLFLTIWFVRWNYFWYLLIQEVINSIKLNLFFITFRRTNIWQKIEEPKRRDKTSKICFERKNFPTCKSFSTFCPPDVFCGFITKLFESKDTKKLLRTNHVAKING